MDSESLVNSEVQDVHAASVGDATAGKDGSVAMRKMARTKSSLDLISSAISKSSNGVTDESCDSNSAAWRSASGKSYSLAARRSATIFGLSVNVVVVEL